MSERQCSVEECDRPYYAKGYCKLHYNRWSKWGDPLIVKQVQYASPEESFEARTMPVTETGCLLWTGGTSADGYGSMWVGGKDVYAHRYAWERVNGHNHVALRMQHLCLTPACCYNDQLRLPTRPETSRNMAGLPTEQTSEYRDVSWSKSTGK